MPEKKEVVEPTHVVATEFHDAEDFDKVYEVGEDVSHFDAERLEKLVANEHVTDLAAVKAAEDAAKADADKEPVK